MESERPRIIFSGTELLHLAGSVAILSIAFSFILTENAGLIYFSFPSPHALLASMLAVASGFVLHELAHKIVAQRMGLWAEYRAQFAGLGITFLLAAFLKLLFAVPGAVLIQGRVSLRQNGIISISGPATNLVIAFCTLPFARALNPASDPIAQTFHVIAYVNALLAVFNMIPVAILDGRKVWWWSRGIYVGAMFVFVGVFLGILFAPGYGTPQL